MDQKAVTEQIHQIAKDLSINKPKPFISILQPRRNLEETPAQQLMSWNGRQIDTTSMAVSYHAIDGNPVDLARCILMEEAIKDDSKYALFVDEDTVLPFFAVTDMLEASEKFPDAIISGVYWVKFGNPMVSIIDEDQRWMVPDTTPNSGYIRNVVSTGLGCALIPMHIIHKLKEQFKDIPLFCVVGEKMWNDDDVTFIGEDAWFYNLVRKAGYEIICDTSVQCLHMELATGKYTAHPDINEQDYVTNIPLAGRLTLEDRARVSKDYMDRICKPQTEEQVKLNNPKP